jgi:DNA-binding response OmpR family regulator
MTTDPVNIGQVSPVNQETEKGRIIVVEDDSDFRDSIVETLSLYGYEATGAKSALDFYYKVSLKTYALVILDLGLPDQNGVILAEFIRQNTEMRIIILTARSSLESRISAYKAGADTYLLKPVNTDELIASVKSNLGRFCSDHDNEKDQHANPLELLASDWKLETTTSTIIAPTGEKLNLTSKEVDFLEHLVQNSGNLSRQELTIALGYSDITAGSKALDVLVHRLRQKGAEIGIKLPVRTMRGKGYYLSEPISIK